MKKVIKVLGIIIFFLFLGAWVSNLVEEKALPAIGILNITGPITSSEHPLKLIREFEKDKDVKAILIRINSPGGVVGPSQEIYEALLRVKGKKPLVASMCSAGASGAYYIACAADKIYALPGTMTGSIGVLMEFVDVSEGMSKLGIKAGSITSGEFKAAGNPFRAMKEKERAYFKDLIMDTQEQFVEAVANGRGLSIEETRKLADGRVFTGRQAKNLKLIDKLGGYDPAIQEAKRLAGITGEARLLKPVKDRGFLEDLGRFLDNSSKIPFQGSAGLVPSVRLEYRMF